MSSLFFWHFSCINQNQSTLCQFFVSCIHIGFDQRTECFLTKDVGTLDITLFFQSRHVTVCTKHRILYQITDNGKHVCLSQCHALPWNTPDHKDQLHIFLRIDGICHQWITLVHVFINVYFAFLQLLVHFFHFHIVNRISKTACFLRRCRKQTGIGAVGNGINRHVFASHQLCQYFCCIEKDFARLILIKTRSNFIQLTKTVILVNDLCR